MNCPREREAVQRILRLTFGGAHFQLSVTVTGKHQTTKVLRIST